MTTLLVSDDGKRRCDENCYDARRHKCTCICEGMNHRLGLEAAVHETRAHAGDEDGENVDLPDGVEVAFDRLWLIRYGSGQTYGTCTSQEEFDAAERVLKSWGAKNIRRVEL
jgi:hypothetical protein